MSWAAAIAKNLPKSKGWKLYLSVQLETTRTPNEAVNTLS